MLLDTFYTLHSKDFTTVPASATIVINASHKIFDGHFPGQPIVPGVCMMQIVREIAELITNKKLRIAQADSMKFLAIIDPRANPEVMVSITYQMEANGYAVNATLFEGKVTFFKFKGMLQLV